jgi:Domain of unknown function (DUF397)
MSEPSPHDDDYRKSRHSIGDGDCVEVAVHGAHVFVRDSKDPTGPTLVESTASWMNWIESIRTCSVIIRSEF